MRFPKPVTIRAHLLLLVLTVLLPTSIAAIWIIDRTYRSEQQVVERNLRDTARALAMVVDAELSKRAAMAGMLANLDVLDAGGAVSADDLQRFAQQARRAVGPDGAWVELLDGKRVLVDTRWSAGAAPLPSRTAPSMPPTDIDAPVLTPLQTSPDGGQAASIIAPVRRDGHTLLEVKLSVLPQDLQRIIDKHTLPPDWLASIVDSQGTIVARYPGGISYAGRTASPDMMRLLLTRSEGLFRSVSLDGMPTFGYFSTSPQGWIYLIAMPRDDSVEYVPLAVRNVAIGAVLLLGLALAAALWVSRRIERPILTLRAAAARMQAGQRVERRATGIAECDEVKAAMADAWAAMQRAHADLESRVAAAIAKTRVAEQRASHSRRVEALGRLTGGVAHDFNNILGIISNSAHLIQRQSPVPALSAPVAATLRAVEVGNRLTQYLLRFAGRQPVRPTVVDLASYMLEVREMIRIVLGKRIELAMEIAPALPPVKVDASELELALINLALNARDALADGGQVSVQVHPAADAADILSLPPGRYVVIAFSDTGQGISADDIGNVFEPFFTTKEAGKGTGLGLSQVHGFCAQAGGTARISSVAGVGTTVRMVLPAAEAVAARRGEQAPPARFPSVAGKRLLLVEDNAELAASTAALLTSFGLQVRRAGTARAALDQLESAIDVDIVLSDVLMPGGMDGLAMARQVRERRPDLPIVLISGFSSALTQARDFVVLHKPCTPDELLHALERALAAPR